MNITKQTIKRLTWSAVAVMILGYATGCHQDRTLDDRTMEDRPHVETEKPVNKDDPFRP